MKRATVVLVIATIVSMMTHPTFAQSHEPTVAIYVISSPGLYEGETQNSVAEQFTKLMTTTNADTNVVVVSRAADCWTRLMPNSSVGRWRLARDAAEVIHQAAHFPTFQDPSDVVAAVERHFLASYAGDVGFSVWTASDGGGTFKTFALHPAAVGSKATDVGHGSFTTDDQAFPFASKNDALDVFLKLVFLIGVIVGMIVLVRHRRKLADKRLEKYLDERTQAIRQKRRATSIFMNGVVAIIILPLLVTAAWCQEQYAFVDFSGSFVKYRTLAAREIGTALQNGPVILFSIGDSTVLVDTLRNGADLRQILSYPVQAHTHLMEAFLTMERVADSVERAGRHPVIGLFTDGLPDDAGNQELALLAGTDTADRSQNLFNAVSAERKNHGMSEWWVPAGTIFCFMVVVLMILKCRRLKHKNSPHLSMAGPTLVRLVTKNKSPMSFDIDDLLANKLSIGASVDSDVRLFNTGNYQLLAEMNKNHGINIVFGSTDGKDGFKLIVENIAVHK